MTIYHSEKKYRLYMRKYILLYKVIYPKLGIQLFTDINCFIQ